MLESMSTPPKRTPSVRNGSIEACFRSYKTSRPNLFNEGAQDRPMANGTTVQIGVIADNQEHIVSLPHTLYDTSLSHSLISRSKAFDTHGSLHAITPITITDSHNHLFTSSSTITLRWRYETGLQSFQETFYIVDGGCAGYDAMLRKDIDTKPADAHPLQAHPLHYDGHYKKSERRDKETKEKESQEQWKREMQADRERMKRNIDAIKKGGRK